MLDACGGRLPGIIFCLGQKEVYVPATTGCAPAHVNHTLNRNRSCKPNGHLAVMLYKLQVLRVVCRARPGTVLAAALGGNHRYTEMSETRLGKLHKGVGFIVLSDTVVCELSGKKAP